MQLKRLHTYHARGAEEPLRDRDLWVQKNHQQVRQYVEKQKGDREISRSSSKPSKNI